MTGKVLVILLILFLLAGCGYEFVDRGDATTVDRTSYDTGYEYHAVELRSWDGRECMFIHVWADDGYRESLLDCED